MGYPDCAVAVVNVAVAQSIVASIFFILFEDFYLITFLLLKTSDRKDKKYNCV